MKPTLHAPPAHSFTPTWSGDEPTAAQLRDRAIALVEVLEAEHRAGVDTAIARTRLLDAITDLSGAASKYDTAREPARCWVALEQHAEEVVMRTKSGRVRVKWSGEEPFGRRLARILDAIAGRS